MPKVIGARIGASALCNRCLNLIRQLLAQLAPPAETNPFSLSLRKSVRRVTLIDFSKNRLESSASIAGNLRY